jgi:hypothetical protein
MVQDMTLRELDPCEAASRHGVTPPTARKWLGRYLAMGGGPGRRFVQTQAIAARN